MNDIWQMASLSSISEDQATELAAMFHLMGDRSRLRIILACLDGPVCVSELSARTGLAQSLVSHHLRLLRTARILKAARRGKQIFYEPADDHVRRTIVDMVAHVGHGAQEESPVFE